MKRKQIFTAGIFKENPNLIMILGMCPTLATTSSLNKAFGMGIAFIIILIITNILISAIRKIVPDEIRIPVFIVVIAAVVSMIEMVLHAYAFTIFESLGLFLSLIVVNCVVLGRAEAFASKNGIVNSILDACGMGLGFAMTLLIVAVFREFLSTGGIVLSNPLNNEIIFDLTQIQFKEVIIDGEQEKVLTEFGKFIDTVKINPFKDAIGGFLVIGFIIAVINVMKIKKENKQKAVEKAQNGVTK